jgi:hypothetical protein
LNPLPTNPIFNGFRQLTQVSEYHNNIKLLILHL